MSSNASPTTPVATTFSPFFLRYKGRAPAVENLAMTIAELLEAKVRGDGRAEGEAAG